MITDAYARRDDLQTSHDAAASVRPTRLEQLVFDALSARPRGATSFELADALGLSLVTISPRLRPLVNKGKVIADGTRAGASGRMQTVWKVAAAKQLIRFDERGQGSFL